MKEQKTCPLNWVPIKYRERVARLEREYDLIDDCKYMLYLNKNWYWGIDDWCVPVKSKKEALQFIKDAYYEERDED